MLRKIYGNLIKQRLSRLACGELHLTLPDGEQQSYRGKDPGRTATLQISSWSAIPRLLLHGECGAVEAFAKDEWQTPDLENLITFFLENAQRSNMTAALLAGMWISRQLTRLQYSRQINSLRGSKINIAAHYDLGNEFFQLWLDPSMTYSSAIFSDDKLGLEQAQRQKINRILDIIGNRPGRVLEIGCGWGSFANLAVGERDHSLHGITLSKQQLDYTSKILRPFGKQAQISYQDYREINGRYDNIVSIEMFEAVGERYWQQYFEKIASSLKSNGKAIIQTITIAESRFAYYRRSNDPIRSFVFPGGMLAPVSRIRQLAARVGLKIVDEYQFAHDYVKTLRIWYQNFLQQSDRIKALGFDRNFMQIWSFYLNSCAASFAIGNTDVTQITLKHG